MIDGTPLFLYKNKVDGVVKSRSSLAKFAGSRVKPPRGFLSATNLIDRGVGCCIRFTTVSDFNGAKTQP